jgi:hypothetical protein
MKDEEGSLSLRRTTAIGVVAAAALAITACSGPAPQASGPAPQPAAVARTAQQAAAAVVKIVDRHGGAYEGFVVQASDGQDVIATTDQGLADEAAVEGPAQDLAVMVPGSTTRYQANIDGCPTSEAITFVSVSLPVALPELRFASAPTSGTRESILAYPGVDQMGDRSWTLGLRPQIQSVTIGKPLPIAGNEGVFRDLDIDRLLQFTGGDYDHPASPGWSMLGYNGAPIVNDDGQVVAMAVGGRSAGVAVSGQQLKQAYSLLTAPSIDNPCT